MAETNSKPRTRSRTASAKASRPRRSPRRAAAAATKPTAIPEDDGLKRAAAAVSEATVIPDDSLKGAEVAVPETLRSMAEQTVNRSREAYEHAKGAVEDTVEVLETSFDKAGEGAIALNRKAIDIAQVNLNSGFDLARDLAGASSLSEIMELQASYLRRQFDVLAAQAEEIHVLTTRLATDTSAPLTALFGKSIEGFGIAR